MGCNHNYVDVPNYCYCFVNVQILIQSFLQIGKTGGKDSISIAVEVASKLIIVQGLTLKFTQEELRGSSTENKCGTTAQSHKFYQLDQYRKWNGEVIRGKK